MGLDTNKKKIIFLDFDGIISTPEYHWRIDPNKVALVEDIIKATDAKIVVSSSWSVGCRNAEEFIERDFSGYFKNKTTEISRESLFIDSIIDVTDHMGSERGDEIQRWLDAHEDDVESYVILDDEMDMLEEQLINFVQTDGYEGITSREVKLAIKVLNKERIEQPARLNMVLMLKWFDRNAGRESNIGEIISDYYKQFKK